MKNLKSSIENRKKVEWWKSAVFYQIYPRSFYDSNNDGIGDLKGIIEKLDHLNDGNGGGLGVDAIWFSPFFPSPQADFGYDVSEYCDIDPNYGTIKDFDKLVDESHKRGIKIILDLVLNHTSDQHKWFKESRKNRKNEKSDWYVWADPKKGGNPPNNWLAVFGGSAWTFEPDREQYFLHNFLPEQPDLNWYHPGVRKELAKIVRFWMSKGADGFRLDTANYYAFDRKLRDNPKRPYSTNSIEDGQEANPLSKFITKFSKDRPENIEFIRFLRKIFDEKENVTSIGEIGSSESLEKTLELGADYVKHGEGLHMAYTFAMLNKSMNAEYFDHVVRFTEKLIEDGWPCWSLSNHDCVRMMTRYNCFGEKDGFQQMMLLLLLSLRGTPIIYYGEEVDMEEYPISKKELRDPQGIYFWPKIKGRDGCRLPFPWDSKSINNGFNNGAEPWLPPKNSFSLDQAKQNPYSTYHVLKEMIKIRKTYPALQYGDFRKILISGECYFFERKTKKQSLIVAANFSLKEQTIKLPMEIIRDKSPKNLKKVCSFKKNTIRLPGCGFFLGEI